MLRKILIAALLLNSCSLGVFSSPALSQSLPLAKQDRDLIARLNDLVRRKGAYHQAGLGLDFCQRLGVKPYGNCELYQARMDKAVFQTFTEPGSGVVRIVIMSFLNLPNYAEDYLVSLDGRLERVIRRSPDKKFVVFSPQEASSSFSQIIELLRNHESTVASIPDAKIFEDSSCPTGRAKRMIYSTSTKAYAANDAVCLERARLN
jgi:hypothetical protein